MNVLQKKWLAALRSGDYEQARGALQDDEGKMCCLGVLCDIVDPDGWEVSYEHPTLAFTGATPEEYEEEIVFEGDVGYPPKWMQELVGLDEKLDQASKLADLNDGGKSFAEIADWLENAWASTP